jgi:hypothetical protein
MLVAIDRHKKIIFLVSVAYISRHQKSIFNNKKLSSLDLGPSSPDLSQPSSDHTAATLVEPELGRLVHRRVTPYVTETLIKVINK